MGVGRRGSKESEKAGRYLNTWPVVISNVSRTVVAADILHFLPPLGLGAQDIRYGLTKGGFRAVFGFSKLHAINPQGIRPMRDVLDLAILV